MAKLIFPTSCSVQDLLRTVTKHVGQLRNMWPWFAVQVVTIKHGGIWKCCYIGVAGRFTPLPELIDWRDDGDSVATVQVGLAGEAMWNLLEALSDTGNAMLDTGEGTLKICVPSMGGGSVQHQGWTRHTVGLQPGLDGVGEKVEWSVLALSSKASWHFGDELLAIHTSTQQVLSDSINWSGESSDFFERQMGVKLNLGECRVDVHLPLGVKVTRHPPGVQGTSLEVRVTEPLRPEEFRVFYSADMFFRSDMPMVTVSDAGKASDGWLEGTAFPPINHGMLSIRHPLFDKPLHYDYPEDPTHTQALDLIGFLYSHNKPDRGLKKWKKSMTEGVGSPFEVALLNSIARFGWPVLFAGHVATEGESEAKNSSPEQHPGQVSTEDKHAEHPEPAGSQGDGPTTEESSRPSKKGTGGGPQTEGFDLIVLDPEPRRALLVSAKGVNASSLTPLQWDVAKLNGMVDRLRRVLAGWTVDGIVVCNKIIPAQLEILSLPAGIRMVGDDWVRRFLTCSERTLAESLLWDTWG